MSVRYLTGVYDGTQYGMAALVDSVSGFAFGPIFESIDEAESFVGWLENDARSYSDNDLEEKHSEWRTLYDGVSA